MRRGDVVMTALSGDQGKPRLALIVQSDAYSDLASVTVLPLTGTLQAAPLFRVQLEPNAQNGLTKTSQAMIDKAQTPNRAKIGGVIGRLDPLTMKAVDRAMAIFLGLA